MKNLDRFSEPVIKNQTEINRLVERAKNGDEQATLRILNSNLRLVLKIAKNFNPEDQEDLISVGELAILQGIHSFDPSRKTKFSTYIFRAAMNSMLTFVHANKLIFDILDEGSLQIPDKEKIQMQDELELSADQNFLRAIISKTADLKNEEFMVLAERFSLFDHSGRVKTYREVAGILKIRLSKVFQLHSSALKKLQLQGQKIQGQKMANLKGEHR